ncbi:hypothetical protein AAMO2058_001577000 [Amorphochlora amoebiformis]
MHPQAPPSKTKEANKHVSGLEVAAGNASMKFEGLEHEEKGEELFSSEFDDATDSDDDGEDLTDYRNGGYHWVEVGDVYNSRFLIHRKLGWGQFSTVWLATDTSVSLQNPNKAIALKILKSSPNYQEAAQEEVDLLNEIMKKPEASIGKRNIVLPIDSFEIYGPHGTHVCIALELMGKSLLSLIRHADPGGLSLGVVKKITFQMALGLHFLHDTCGIVHTDLKPENFLLTRRHPIDIRALEAATLQQVRAAKEGKTTPKNTDSNGAEQKRINRLRIRSRKRQMSVSSLRTLVSNEEKTDAKSDGGELVSLTELPLPPSGPPTLSQQTSTSSSTYHEGAEVKICDLGNAVYEAKDVESIISTRQYRSPEVILGRSFDRKSDIWSLGCIIFEMLTGDYLFDPDEETRGVSRDEHHLQLMIELLGELPKEWVKDRKYSHEFFTYDGHLRNAKVMGHWGLKLILNKRYRIPEADAVATATFLENLLRYNPKDRWSTSDLLCSDWLSRDFKRSGIGHLIKKSTSKSSGTQVKTTETLPQNITSTQKVAEKESPALT